jgi:hypothetical protein
VARRSLTRNRLAGLVAIAEWCYYAEKLAAVLFPLKAIKFTLKAGDELMILWR